LVLAVIIDVIDIGPIGSLIVVLVGTVRDPSGQVPAPNSRTTSAKATPGVPGTIFMPVLESRQ
jgi:hypothetical protein